MIRAPRLQVGDTVGIVSPSWGGAGAFPHRVELGIKHLQSLGFNAKVAPNALNRHGYVSDTPERRVEDIHQMFRDPSVQAIISAIGGDHSCHLLPLLDFDLIRSNPKVFMGFSDITVLNIAIWKATGLVTFNGPALLPDFAEYPRMFEYTERYFLKTVCEPGPVGAIEPSPVWTEEFLDWEKKEDLQRPRTLQPSEGWTWLKAGKAGAGAAEGVLIGGCLESLHHLRSTPYWPDREDWRGAIFFFETSDEKPLPETVDSALMDYENMGVLEKLGGMLVGRPMKYTSEEKAQLREVILERTASYAFPIVTDMDFGHTAPQFTLPIGCRARLDPQARRFTLIEPAVQ
jgi:muramoyltetrapeptide carboxypeptidase LdcA involved in peptidoglycan recycling